MLGDGHESPTEDEWTLWLKLHDRKEGVSVNHFIL